MLDEKNKYTIMQKNFYENNSDEMNEGNHLGHNSNSEYWDILLWDVINNKDYWNGKIALDFGAGCGRNIINLLNLVNWKQIIGVDISENNLNHIKQNINLKFDGKFNNIVKVILSNGIDINNISNDYIDFIMSTIVLQHICVWEIRFNILKEIYRILKNSGLFSFQMGFSTKLNEKNRDYFDNFYDAEGTNSACDCVVSDPDQIINDLMVIGFDKNKINYKIGQSWFNEQHENWIYIKCFK